MSGSHAKSFGSWASRPGGPEQFDPATVAGCSSLKFLMIREKKDALHIGPGMAPFGPASKHEAKPGSQRSHPDFEDVSVSSAAPTPDREECI
jgi:hypothetical protein